MNGSVSKVLKYLFAFTICVTNASSVSFIHKCRINDYACTLKSTQYAIPIFAAGIPELGVSVLDPMYLKEIDGSSDNMKFKMNDLHLKGLKDCIAKKTELRDVNNTSKKLTIETVCSVEINGQYELKGHLIVPIEGKGNVHAVLNDTNFQVDCILPDKIGKDGKKYLNLKSCSHTHEFKPNALVHLDNLFPHNEILAQAAREVIESKPDAIIAELGPPTIKSIMEVVVKNVANFVAKVPYEDLVILN